MEKLKAVVVAIQEKQNVLELLADESLPLDMIDPDWSPLHWAAHCDEPDYVSAILSHPRCNANIRDHRSGTFLHKAVARQSIRSVRKIVELCPVGLNLDAVNSWGETALHLAASAGFESVVHILVEAKCDINARDQWQRTPLGVAMESGEEGVISLLTKYNAVASACPRTFEHDENYDLKEIQSQLTEEFMDKVRGMSLRAVAKDAIPSKSAGLKPVTPPSPNVAAAPALKKPALSKKIEYPGDPQLVTQWLCEDSVDILGLDMYGLSALQKLAGWDAVCSVLLRTRDLALYYFYYYLFLKYFFGGGIV